MTGCRRRWPNPASSGMRHSRRGAEEDDEVTYVDPNEGPLREAVSLEEPRALIHRFSTLVRESGSDDEWTAAREIAGRLAAWGVPHTVHEPLLYLSVPERASLEVLAPQRRSLRAKTPSFSVSTDGTPVRGQVVYVPTVAGAPFTDTFDAPLPAGVGDVSGRIVLTEGFPSPQKVLALQQRGAGAIIFTHPGQAIHEMICTTIWGAPDLDSLPRKPTVAVVSVNRPDGEALVAMAKNGGLDVALHTRLREGGMRCPVVVAEIPGTDEPDVFLLAPRHLDSRHARLRGHPTRGATPLELARLFLTHRAGDWSFNNLGLSGFFMLFSTMPKPLLAEKGYYPVGGCGANIAWHTEDDTLPIFDEHNLDRDLRAYVTTVVRALNAPVHPLDFRAAVREFGQTLVQYQGIAGERFDLSTVVAEAGMLERALDRFYDRCEELATLPVTDARVRAANAAIRRIARQLVQVNFARSDRFHHDTAAPIQPLPDLAAVRQLGTADPVIRGFVQAHLVRGRNRVVWALREARRTADEAR